jgi:hypothetical protein
LFLGLSLGEFFFEGMYPFWGVGGINFGRGLNRRYLPTKGIRCLSNLWECMILASINTILTNITYIPSRRVGRWAEKIKKSWSKWSRYVDVRMRKVVSACLASHSFSHVGSDLISISASLTGELIAGRNMSCSSPLLILVL